ncbi:MAG: response regulator [Pseudomonadota bacterium]
MSAVVQQSILLFEDNPEDAYLLRARLGAARVADDFKVDLVTTLEDGLRQLSSQQYDLILLDLSLPDSEGVATFERVFQRKPNTPIIVLSGDCSPEVGPELIARGAQDFIEKDKISVKGLGKQLEFAMGRRQATAVFQQRIEADSIYWLADTIAGEFNEVLSSMMSSLGSIEGPLKDKPDALASARRASEQALAGTDIMHLLLTLARPPSQINKSGIKAVIDDLVPSLKQQFGTLVRLTVSDETCDWQTGFDDAQVRTIVSTLVSNAARQVTGGVSMNIKVSEETLGERDPHAPSDGIQTQVCSIQISAKRNSVNRHSSEESFVQRAGHKLIQRFVERSGGQVYTRQHPVLGVTIELLIPRQISAADSTTQDNASGIFDVRSKNVVCVDLGEIASGGIADQVSILGYHCTTHTTLAGAAKQAASGVRADMIMVSETQLREEGAARLLTEILDYSFESRLLVVSENTAPDPELIATLPMPATTLVAPETLAEVDTGVRAGFFAELHN